MHFENGDVLFLLDAIWDIQNWEGLEKAKLSGAKIIYAVYDLIPITHPDFCGEEHINAFNEYYQHALVLADGFFAISQTVRDEVRQYVLQYPIDRHICFDYFYLGADFTKQPSDEIAVSREHIRQFFQKESSVYLIVSTIEPRKNHAYLLDAFEQLWHDDQNVALCIVGKVGWQVTQLIERLTNHPEKNNRLVVWHDINDDELMYCYQHSKCLVFPSIIEGFGLPIVEAFKHQLPVIASDINIHREIGGDLAMYVDLSNAQSLVNRVKDIEQHGFPEEHRPPENYEWLSWEDATKILLKKLTIDFHTG